MPMSSEFDTIASYKVLIVTTLNTHVTSQIASYNDYIDAETCVEEIGKATAPPTWEHLRVYALRLYLKRI
jgi:hypothetical protein